MANSHPGLAALRRGAMPIRPGSKIRPDVDVFHGWPMAAEAGLGGVGGVWGKGHLVHGHGTNASEPCEVRSRVNYPSPMCWSHTCRGHVEIPIQNSIQFIERAGQTAKQGYASEASVLAKECI